MKQGYAYEAAKHGKLARCPLCKRSVPQLSGMVCANCHRNLMDVRKEAEVQKTSVARLGETSNQAITQSKGPMKKEDGLYAVSLFEMVCFGGGIAILIGYLTSDFYFVLTVVIVMVLLVVTLLIELIEIR